MPTKMDRAILESALIGIAAQKQKLDEKAAEIRQMLDGNQPGAVAANSAVAPRKRRKMSAAARTRIALAQKARWAKFHRESQPANAAGAPKKLKRKLSAVARARLVANLKKARAAKAHKAKAAAR
jgi:hypothetical protein